jgi:hypothetical protein
MAFHDTLFKTKFHENQASSVYMVYEFETGDVWRDRLPDFHKTNTTNGKPTLIWDNNFTYSRLE